MSEVHLYMRELFLTINPEVSATVAAQYMRSENVTALLVGEEGNYAGIVTGVDFTCKLVAEGLNPDQTKVSDIMSQPLISLDRNKSMSEAFLCMRKNQIRHVLVTEGDKISGLLTLSSFAQYASKKFKETQNPIEAFWHDYDSLLDQNYFMASVDKLLKEIRPTLDSSTHIAKAIDSKLSLQEISICAKEEGYTDLAEILDLADY